MSNKNQEEIEVVYTNIDIKEIEELLKKIKAEKIKDIFYKSVIFDYPDLRLNKKGAWIRLRDNGEKVKLAFKQRIGMGDGKSNSEDIGMKEVEFEVSNFEAVIDFMLNIGFIIKFQQEKKRIRWQKNDVFFDIDTWPKLNPYLEIESDNMEKIDKVISELGLDIEKKRIINNFEIYKENGIDILEYKKMTFDEFIKK